MGKLLKGRIEKVKGVVALKGGVPVYRIKEDIELYDGTKLKKGWCFYIDQLHKKEIEVFDGCEDEDRQVLVVRTNGTVDVEKTNSAIKKNRPFKRKR